MKHSFYELSKIPVTISHRNCGGACNMYAIEWPVRLAICTNCGAPLKLVGYDKATQQLAFRNL